MSETREDRLSPAETRARDAVQAMRPAPADVAFRERLKQSFTTGAFPAPARRIVPLPWYRRGVAAWIAVPAAAAAALTVVLVLNQGPRWDIAGAEGAGVVIVDGRPIPMNHGDDLRRALHAGARVVVPADGEIQIACSDNMLILAAAGTEFVVPAAPGRWFGRTVTASMERGVLRVATRSGFSGGRLLVTTPDAAIEVRGSTLAIICEAPGTCVCVLEGEVQVGSRNGEMAGVEGGMRRFVFKDGSAETDEMRPMERTKLTMFREQALGST